MYVGIAPRMGVRLPPRLSTFVESQIFVERTQKEKCNERKRQVKSTSHLLAAKFNICSSVPKRLVNFSRDL